MLTTTGSSAALGSRTWNGAMFTVRSHRTQPLHGLVEGSCALFRTVAHPGVHPPLPAHVDVADVGAAAADDERVHQSIRVVATEGGGIALKHHHVGEVAGRECAGGLTESCGAAVAG